LALPRSLALAAVAGTAVFAGLQPSVRPATAPAAVAQDAGGDSDAGGDADAGALATRRPEYHLSPAATELALEQMAAVAAQSASDPAARGRWSQYGIAPELDNVSDYTPIDAIPTMSGRVQDFAYDPHTHRLFAAVGGGGIWESTDTGQHWHSLTDGLPATTAGGVGFSPAQGGTIIDGTGDSGYSYAGLGIWRSVDGGATWQKATGVPDGLLTFRIAVDPNNPEVVYAATSRGLYRSNDDAQTFRNVDLPTGRTSVGATYVPLPNSEGSSFVGPDCAGDTTKYQCVFQNYVTDVVVRPADAGGSDRGGEVLAAVGWYRGSHFTETGWSNAPNNGLFYSATGLPGSFTDLHADQNGFISPRGHTGYISLGVADGPQQNHNIVFAMVEDAQRVEGGLPGVDPARVMGNNVPGACAVAVDCYTTVLGGIYVSTDFGHTWTDKLPLPESLSNCAVTGTDQCLVLAAPAPVGGNYGPGAQAWYNNWIHVDPTVQDSSGQPTRVFFGLEEPWEVDNPMGTLFSPHTIGRYFGNGFCPYLPIAEAGVDFSKPPACPGIPDAPTTTHPDQHGAILIPDGSGGVTLVLGNDGGVFTQHVAAGGSFDNQHWGEGANVGLATLLPYMAVMAKDGVAYAGLQDNGEIRVTPDGRIVEIYGGDGFYSAVDPNNSRTTYEEYAYDQVHASKDGGHTWTEIFPQDTSAQFSAPIAMDPLNANHLLTGGEFVTETVSGPDTTEPNNVQGVNVSTTSSTDYAQVFDTGSGNSLSAIGVRGTAVYAGYCGYCYIPSTVKPAFGRGLATNVGGTKPPKSMSGDGWHVAHAKGLPQRYISSIVVDPKDPRTVYVSMGNYDPGIDYRPPGAFGDDVSALGTPGVYKSTDAGEHFTNISANLPNATANWLDIRGSQLLVATNVGVFMSRDLSGQHWTLLGAPGSRAARPQPNPHAHFGLASQVGVRSAAGAVADGSLPVVPVVSVQVDPGNPNRLLVATYGRGLWVYDFPTGSVAPVPSSASQSRSGGTAAIALPNTAAAGLAALPAGLGAGAFVFGLAWLGARRRRRAGSPGQPAPSGTMRDT
jgi:hypothetical protein